MTTRHRLTPRRHVAILGLAGAMPLAFLVACGGDAPATVPAATPTRATPTPAMVPTASAPGTPATTGAALAPAIATSFIIDQARSVARFRVNEQLAGRDLASDAVGTSKGVTGTLAFTPAGTIDATRSKVSVDLNALQSDSGMRDAFIKRATLEVSKFAMAEFVPARAEGLPSPLPATGAASFKLFGTLTVHGVAKQVAWDVTATRDGRSLTGDATTTVTFGDFGMSPPRAGAVVSVKDEIRLEIRVVATEE